ncbi:DUF167 family protein [Oceanospirillum sediminis]|uniref:UPF0235 protein H4O21_07445 n=1 Tax=Oceanospirillum sediminis TaxID=2760088 RepID=A0A839INH0_9GAMM|nr:DUF167 family protein [Oceanospirillum sediminis]MBB1486441.1 YggU family protein [Oceanospirillum sediminis]
MTSSFCQWDGDDLIIACHLQPKAGKDEFCGEHDGRLKIRITAPPVDGKANAHLCKFLARQFGVSKSKVHILQGELSRQKRVRIQAPEKLPEIPGLQTT